MGGGEPAEEQPTLVEGSVEGGSGASHQQHRTAATAATETEGQAVHFPGKLQTRAQGTACIYPKRLVGWWGRPDQV
jgi:hypothetical protein